jgi:transposase
MLSLSPTIRIWLAAAPTDLRKSFDSLAALVQGGLQGDPLSGDIFVFRSKSADRVKLLVWEEDGYAIWYKRLEVGTFRFPPSVNGQPRVEIRAADLVMLLEGVDLSSVKRGKRYHRPVARAAVTAPVARR